METIKKPAYLEDTKVSDGSELIPAEIQPRAEREGGEPPNNLPAQGSNQDSGATGGFTVDQEGLVNNYAVTPEPYLQERPRFGFTRYAELLNGRLAMLGFVLLIVTELLMGESFVTFWGGLG